MSLAAAQNPLDPREALVFFYSHPSNNSALTNLGVYRRSLTGGENPPYRDFNIETSNLRLAPSGLVIAFYNGAPRVFGFSKAQNDNDRSIVTQLSPTWTPIADINDGPVQGLWRPAIAAVSDFSEDSAYVFYLEPESASKASLVRYNLSRYSPQSQRYDLNANIDSMLAAVKMRGSGNLRIFFQPETNANYIHVYDIGNQTSERIPDIECWRNSPVAVAHLNNNEADTPQYLYLYYVDGLRRIIRIKYSYMSRSWHTTPSQVGRRIVPNFPWLAVVPVEDANKVHVFYTEDTGEVVQLIDDVTVDIAPTALN